MSADDAYLRTGKLAARCRDGCGWTGRRVFPSPARPCPRCGAPVDVGHPIARAVSTRAGGVGGRVELVWSDWPATT